MKLRVLVVLVAALGIGSACGVVDPPEIDAFEEASERLSQALPQTLADAFCRYDHANDPPRGEPARTAAQVEDIRVRARNDLAGKAMFVIDYNYQQYIDNFSANRGGTKMALDAVSITTAGAATVSTPVLTARLLAAISTMVQALSKASDEHVFLGMATTAFVTQTQKDRAEVRSRILKSLTLPSAQYSIYECVSDLSVYAEAGNINTAAAKLQEQNAAATKKAKDDIETFRTQQVDIAREERIAALKAATAPTLFGELMAALRGQTERK